MPSHICRYKERFNSQRDGILLKPKDTFLSKVMFQFPTGLNSTKNKQGEVQASRGFNSQRDGILPFGEIGYRLTKSGFNSQQDGIPLKILNEKL